MCVCACVCVCVCVCVCLLALACCFASFFPARSGVGCGDGVGLLSVKSHNNCGDYLSITLCVFFVVHCCSCLCVGAAIFCIKLVRKSFIVAHTFQPSFSVPTSGLEHS